MKSHTEVLPTPKAWLHYLAIFLGFLILMLLVAGALVTSNEAGDSVPDWPLSFGRWLIPSENFVANVRYEYSHRFIAGVVGFVTFLLALCIWFAEKRNWLRRLAWLAFLGVVAQAAIGGVRVLFPEYKPMIAVPHALIAQSFFGLIVAIALFTSRSWFRAPEVRPDVQGDGEGVALRTLTPVAIGAVLIQLVLGAGFRHGAWGIVPHVLGAVVVVSILLWTVMTVIQRHGDNRYLTRPAWAALMLLAAQFILGILTYLARLDSAGMPARSLGGFFGSMRMAPMARMNEIQPVEPMITLTALHLVVGALTLAAMIVLTLRSYQVLAPQSEKVKADSLSSTAGKATV